MTCIYILSFHLLDTLRLIPGDVHYYPDCKSWGNDGPLFGIFLCQRCGDYCIPIQSCDQTVLGYEINCQPSLVQGPLYPAQLNVRNQINREMARLRCVRSRGPENGNSGYLCFTITEKGHMIVQN